MLVNGEERANHCDMYYEDKSTGIAMHCTKVLHENNSIASNVLCGTGEFLYFSSNARYIELRFKNCSLEQGVFSSIPISDILSFTSGGINQILRNNVFQGICLTLKIIVSGNNISFIEPNAFNCTNLLLHLDLSNNLIEVISNNIFSNLTHLNSLDLSKNRIRTLSENSFYKFGILQKLNLRRNNLKNMTNLPFKHLGQMKFLELSENLGLLVPEKLFEGQSNLEILFLDHCDIKSLPDNVFDKLHKLQYLYLHHNRLQALHHVYFNKLHRLQFLTAASNEISIIENGTFSRNFELHSLFLAKNKISSFEKESFEGLYSLKNFDVSWNNIRAIVSFEHLKRLHYLNISQNFLTSLPEPNTFQFNSELEEIDLSFNYLSDIRPIRWQELKYLKMLMVTENKVKQLFIPEIHYDLEMHIERNKVKSVYVNVNNVLKNESNHKFTVYLKDNPLSCACNVYELYSVINGKSSLPRVNFADGLNCHLPLKHRGKLLNNLNMSDFQCTSCPEGCSCDFAVYDFIENKINCNNQNFDTIPFVTSTNVSLLYFNGNNLKTLEDLKEKIWENLIQLHVENNKVTSQEFQVPAKLKFLGFKNNRMTTLPQSIQKHAVKNNDFKMTLSNNLWPCNCSVIPFKDFLFAHEAKIDDVDNVRCAFQNETINTEALILMNNSDLCPSYVYYLTVYGYIIGVLFLLVSLILTFYYKKKTHILSFMYTHCNSTYMVFCCDQPNEEERLFDCFISYSSADADVAYVIVEELENKPPYYNFCVHERNWTPGEYITKNIIISVQNSKKTLIILSKDFVKSQWFHLEFQAAYSQTLQDKKNRMIFVLKGELPDKDELESDVKHALSTTTYLQWGERWFWEKLRYALHEHKSFTGSKENCSICGLWSSLFSNNDAPQKDNSVVKSIELEEC